MSEPINNVEERKALQSEVNAWGDIFTEMGNLFGKTRKELNDKKYRKLFELIERWAYYDRLRREELKEAGSKACDSKGVLWDGEE